MSVDAAGIKGVLGSKTVLAMAGAGMVLLSSSVFGETPTTQGLALNTIVMGEKDGSVPAGLPMAMMPHMRALFDQIRSQGLEMTINLGDGTTPVRVLDEKTGDKFLPGKLALGLSYVLIDLKERKDPAYADYLAAYQDITRKMMAKNAQGAYIYDNTSFGEYYYLLALNRLNDRGMLGEVFDETMLKTLKERLNFYDMFKTTDGFAIENYELNLPQNYYAVAYAIAGLRSKLGWENHPLNARDEILAKLLAHYEEDSSGGFSDEADRGGARFDRYSALLIAETVQRSIEMGNEAGITDKMKGYLRKSVDLILPQLNTEGQGFTYGRSIGPYGDSAFMEILTAAANLNLLSEKEKEIAYAFIERVAHRYATFWHDPESRSINMWVKGRGTDTYRNTRRTLGENFSMLHQYLYVNGHWNKLGFADKPPMKTAELQKWLDGSQPRASLTWYNLPDDKKHPYSAALVTVRDKKRVINLNLSQAPGYTSNTPYFPIPFADGLIYGTTDKGYPLLLPQVTLPNGESYAPVSYYQNLNMKQDGKTVIVSYDMPRYRMIRDAQGKEAKDSDKTIALAARTTFTFHPNAITRTDVITPGADIAIGKVETDYTSFAALERTARNADKHSIAFKDSTVKSYGVKGFETCAEPEDFSKSDLSATPIGRLNVKFSCASGPAEWKAGQAQTFSWTLDYHDLP